jgi:thymidylate synthase
VIADAHIYDRHIPMVEELIKKQPFKGPTLWVDPEVKDFYQFTTDSFRLENYQFHPFEHKIPVAV